MLLGSTTKKNATHKLFRFLRMKRESNENAPRSQGD